MAIRPRTGSRGCDKRGLGGFLRAMAVKLTDCT
jgi:hypothetical protein